MAGQREARAARTRIWQELQSTERRRSSTKELSDEQMLALIDAFNEKWAEELARIDSKYPPDPPNAACHHAVIRGLKLTNSTWINADPQMLSAPGDLVDFFRAGSEIIKIWTDKKDHLSLLLADFNPRRPTAGIWRTSAVLLELAIALSSNQEHNQELGYSWIYHFQPDSPFEQQELLEDINGYPASSCVVQTVDYWLHRADILELLIRSETFFVASQLLCYAFKSHWFCLECALRPPERRQHEHPEPDIWNLAASIPAMESGILQATRCVEALLGKPGDRDNPQKLERAKKRWRTSVTLDPDVEFTLVQKSYLEYYYELFERRNSAAHSYGRLPPDLKRAEAVAAQTFAHVVLLNRFQRDAVSTDEAQRRLQFNSQLLKNVGRCQFGLGGGTMLARGS